MSKSRNKKTVEQFKHSRYDDTQEVLRAAQPKEESVPEPRLRPDPPARLNLQEFGEFNHPLYLHSDVDIALKDSKHLRKRLGIVLQHLAAHGRTSVVKGCRDEANRGWFRSPLGGHNGMQYYLWWAPQGNRPIKDLDIESEGIVVRAVRHHNNHEPLAAGELSKDYYPLDQRALDEDKMVGRPWTESQLRFIRNKAPVRMALGRPGSGKTTVLWKAVDTRRNQRVLYLTWSRELSRYAREHFDSFSPTNVHVETRDFATFLGEFCQSDLKRQALSESRAAFEAAISRLGITVLGPWADRKKALYAEARAFLFGRAVPGNDNTVSRVGMVRLNDVTYRAQRGHRNGIGKVAAGALIKTIRAIENSTDIKSIFPELAAAAKSIELLRQDDLPEGLVDFDRVVVDEIQDLTLLESAVVIELCRAIARKRGQFPWLLMAGDEGQTVRPSGFDWGVLNDMVTSLLAEQPKTFYLEDNLRCPRRIGEVIERASRWYGDLEKERRPKKQRNHSSGQHVEAHLFHVDVERKRDAVGLLKRLQDVDGVVVLSPQDDPPAWVPKSLQEVIMGPAEAKGLEYQSVCLLDPGRLIKRLDSDKDESKIDELEASDRRTTIDQLRVALSRATETLAFIDVEVDEETRRSSLALLGDPAPYDPEDLYRHFADADTSIEERVLACTRDAEALIDERPQRAWRRALQAIRLLGDPELPNGVADEKARNDAYATLLVVAARLLVDGIPPGLTRHDVIDAAEQALKEQGSPRNTHAFKELEVWSRKRTNSPVALLQATVSLGRDGRWLTEALASVAQTLRHAIDEGSKDQHTATEYADKVEEWLKLTGFTGDVDSKARQLRCQAVNTLLDSGNLKSAERVFEKIQPEDAFCTGRIREVQGRSSEAAEAFERAGAIDDARRNWRTAGKWEEAIRLAAPGGSEKVDLEWLVEFETLVRQRPEAHTQRLTPAERKRLSTLLDQHSLSSDR